MDSDSDSDESQGMNSFSPFEQRSFHKKKSQERKLQSKLSFTLNLNKGNMHMASKVWIKLPNRIRQLQIIYIFIDETSVKGALLSSG